jgi:hypothetical protein
MRCLLGRRMRRGRMSIIFDLMGWGGSPWFFGERDD